MKNRLRIRTVAAVCAALASATISALTIASCGTAPTPFPVVGPGSIGNVPPTLTILQPNANLTISQGDPFQIRWTDSDPDDNATIDFLLVETATGQRTLLVAGVDEDDAVGPDVIVVDGATTLLVPEGTYQLAGVIDDGVNQPVESFALVAGEATPRRVVITIVGPGEGPQTVPPTIVVTQPSFNLSVSQDDVFTISVQPTELPPDASLPFDPDSTVQLFVVLDFDQNPNNDDPRDPASPGLIRLRNQTLQPGDFDAIPFNITVDLSTIPPRPDGEPYFIRASVFDGTNLPVHRYAVGTISVVRLASGTVDLFEMGRTLSGARFHGFNPQAHLGSSITTVTDFDADGVDDFLMAAQFGNPQNVGPVGEAYLVYGQGRSVADSPIVQPGNKFGGAISVNTIADTLSGAVFQAPPIRTAVIPDPAARTDGITDVSFIPDLTQDGRPEILIGLPHVHGAYDSTDYDPGDSDLAFGCYPDGFEVVNNCTDSSNDDFGCKVEFPGEDRDTGFYAGGMAVLINSQNRDSDPQFDPPPVRLESTAIDLELVGQFLETSLDAAGTSEAGIIFPRAHNAGLPAPQLGDDPSEPGRIAGARFIAGGYEFIDPFVLQQGPREGLFGQTVRALTDLDSDLLPEIIISAPRNERFLADLRAQIGFFSTHLRSTTFPGSITVMPGLNYNQQMERDIPDDTGTSITPRLDHFRFPPAGRCGMNPEPRTVVLPAGTISIFAEDMDDFLGDGQSAGDVNQDGIGDILCGAPRNSRSPALVQTGASYIIYGRPVFGEINLAFADDPRLRPPMLRIRGQQRADRIGWIQSAVLDVNGDRIDDVVIASPHTDFGGIERPQCGADFNNDGVVDTSDLSLDVFEECVDLFGDEVFTDDPCAAFDYDANGLLDDDDRCVFCCLSPDCRPDEACVFGRGAGCCDNLVNNGFIAVIFGGVRTDGDRILSQIATSELPGAIFFGSEALHRAGHHVASAGDFNRDGFGDLLIAVPGETRVDSAARQRLGVVYLIFGGTHLNNGMFNLNQVGSPELPGIVFISPYVKGRPNEAAPTTVAFIGDINADGFGDIAVGNPKADFIDPSFPQGPDAPGTDAAVGRRSNTGDVYLIYGNNFGSNRAIPSAP